MNIFANLRFIVLARRGVIALERLADAHADIAKVYVEDYKRANSRTKPRPTEFGQMDVESVEKKYAEQLEEELRDV